MGEKINRQMVSTYSEKLKKIMIILIPAQQTIFKFQIFVMY